MTRISPQHPLIYGYGEDSLTLWAFKEKLPDIARALDDNPRASGWEVLYRPGFGRKGGSGSAEFGEFDFIAMSPTRLYLGESKWNRSTEVKKGGLFLESKQRIRHALFRKYVVDWFNVCASANHKSVVTWSEFVKSVPPSYKLWGTEKRVAPPGSQTSESLQFALGRIWRHFEGELPGIMNVILYFYDPTVHVLPRNKTGFRFVSIRYDESKAGYVKL